MNFASPEKVQQTIRAGDEVAWVQGANRTKINNQANCFPPLDPDDAEKLGLKINFNTGEMMRLLAHARLQYMSAFWSQLHLFKVTVPLAPAQYRSEWEATITQELNRIIRSSLSYFELHRSRWAAVSCHGIGPQVWYKPDYWRPDYVAIGDLRLPTDTTTDFENLGWFAVRHAYTPFELIQAVFSRQRKNGWNKKSIMHILKNYKELNTEIAGQRYDWETQPEKLAELIKQDGGFYSGDAMPSIPLWHFYFEDSTDPNKSEWFMRVVPDQASVAGNPPDEFLWERDEPIAKERSQIMHCQLGDLNNDAPFKIASTRSLGFALMEPCFYQNLTDCRFMQHVHDNFNIWINVTDPADRSRPLVQEFGNFGVVRPGINIVPQTQRHQIQPDLVEMVQSRMKQLQQEASASYTQQVDTGTKKEQTAFETRVKLQQINALMGGLLMTAFIYAGHEYREICRRFCLARTDDPDILQFKKAMQKAKVPAAWLQSHLWEVEPVTPLGMGNPTMATAEAQELMQNRAAYGPEAQQEILHEFTLVTTNDPRKAQRWAPLGKNKPLTEGSKWAMAIFGTLMQGTPLPPPEGLNPIDQIETLLPLLAGVVVRLEKRDNMATSDEAAGMGTVAQYIQTCIQQLAQDKQEAARAKQYADALKNLTNQMKGLAQRGAEHRQQTNGGPNPVDQAKISSLMMTSMAKIKAKDVADQQRLQHREQAFTREQRRKDAEAWHEMGRDAVVQSAKLSNGSMRSMEE